MFCLVLLAFACSSSGFACFCMCFLGVYMLLHALPMLSHAFPAPETHLKMNGGGVRWPGPGEHAGWLFAGTGCMGIKVKMALR